MNALHLLYLPTSWAPVPQNHPCEIETYQVHVPMLPRITTGFWDEDSEPPRITTGGELVLEVEHPNNFSRLLEVKDSLLLAIEQAQELEECDRYPQWLRFRLEESLALLQDDIEGRRLPSGLPAWNPVTATAEIREVA